MKKPEFSFANKVVLVTGAAGGIGRAISEQFGAAGARLFLNGFQEEKLAKFALELSKQGVQNDHKAIDITALGAPEELVGAVIEKFGKIDVLVNCAGINRPQSAEDVTDRNWDNILDVNLKALFFMCQAAGRELIKRDGGKIVNISSQAGIVAIPGRTAYAASKSGVNQLTRNLALEWAKFNINVNAVAPTFVLTSLTKNMLADEDFQKYVIASIPLGRMAEPEEVAYATLFLASDMANMITGHVLSVDGGWTIH